MSFEDCIRKRIGKNLSKDKAQEALDLYADRKKRLEDGGMDPDQADLQAARDTFNSIDNTVITRRRQVARAAKVQQRIQQDLNSFNGDDFGAAAVALLDFDEKAPYANVVSRQEKIRGELHSIMTDALAKHGSKGLGIKQNKAGLDDIVREIFGVDTKSKSAKELAEAWQTASEYARQRSNSAGANIPKRDDWGLPQSHNRTKVAEAGKDEWMRQVANKLDWDKMLDMETGQPVLFDERGEILGKIYDTIVTDGFIKKPKMGAGARRSLANRLHDHRFLVFKSPDDWMDYNSRFGDSGPFETMVGHLDKSARDIAMMEILGPNPNATKEWLKGEILSKAAQVDAKTGKPMKKSVVDKAKSRANTMDDIFGVMTGQNSSPARPFVAHTMAGLRNLLTSAYLGSASLVAIPGDFATGTMMAKYSGIPATRFMKGYFKAWRQEDAKLAVRLGLIAENWTALAFGQERLIGEVIGPQITQRITDTVLRASLLSPHTQAARWAFGMEFMGFLGDSVGKKMKDLPEPLQKTFSKYGISEQDWNLMRKTELYDHKGATFLRPDDVMGRTDLAEEKSFELADKFMRMVQTETNFAVPTSSIRARTFLTGNTKPGTLVGEIARSFAMFKNFPVTIAMTHMRRGLLQESTMKKGKYLAALTASMTVAGALAIQFRQITQGKDPRDMTDPKFWGAAVLQGGGMGIWGDFLFNDLNRFGGGKVGTVAGPVTQFAGSAIDLTIGNAVQAAAGEETNVGKEAIKFVRRNMPGGSIWYLRAAIDRLVSDQLQKMADPDAHDAFRRMEKNALREYDQRYWWKPGKLTPDRAPNINEALKE